MSAEISRHITCNKFDFCVTIVIIQGEMHDTRFVNDSHVILNYSARHTKMSGVLFFLPITQ